MVKHAKGLARLALTITAFVAIFAALDFRQLSSSVSSIGALTIVAAIAFSLLRAFVSAIRLSAVLALYGRILPLGPSLRITLESAFFNHTFVSFIGGDAIRIWRIRHCGLALQQIAGAVVFDRFIGVVANHVLLLAALPWLLLAIGDAGLRLALIALAVLGVVGIVLVLSLSFVAARLRERIPQRFRTPNVLGLVKELETLGRLMGQPNRYLLLAGAMSLLKAGFGSLIFFALLLGMGVQLNVAFGCALLVPAVLQIAMLPGSVAGWGIREGAAIVAFSGLGVPADTAFLSSILYALVVLAVSLIGGLLWLFDYREIGTLWGPESRTVATSDSAHSGEAD